MRLVIAGAGFAGMYAALSAARMREIHEISRKSWRSHLSHRNRCWWFALGCTSQGPRR